MRNLPKVFLRSFENVGPGVELLSYQKNMPNLDYCIHRETDVQTSVLFIH